MKRKKKGAYHHIKQKLYPPSLILISYLLICGFFSLRGVKNNFLFVA